MSDVTLPDLDQVKYDANGLVPAVVQDFKDGQVLMVAYMNKEALRRTLTSMHHVDAMEQLTRQLERFKTNEEFVQLIGAASVDIG